MLPKKHRLKRKKDFARAYRKGNFIKGDFLIIRTTENQLNYSRFGIVVSKNVSKKATERNKVKRRIREAIRPQLNKIKVGFDVIVIGLPEVVKKNFWEIGEELKKVFSKAGLFK